MKAAALDRERAAWEPAMRRLVAAGFGVLLVERIGDEPLTLRITRWRYVYEARSPSEAEAFLRRATQRGLQP